MAEPLEPRTLLSTATFSPPTNYPVAPITRITTIADFNGDGKPDIAGAVSLGGSQVVTLLNNGNGTFSPPLYFPAEIPRSVAAADFNHDGKMDLAVGSGTAQGTAVVLIFDGNGDGTFIRPPARYPLPGGGQAIMAADLNGDGWADLVVATGRRLAILLNNGNGTFAKPVFYAIGNDNPTGLAIADFNNDGVPDIAVSRGAMGRVTILLGNKSAPGTFGAPAFFPAGDNPQGLTVGDFNHDGNQDLAVVSSQFRGIAVDVLLGNGNGSFRPPAHYTGPNFSDAIVSGNFSGTGNGDLAVGSFTGDLRLYPGNGDGTFGTPTTIPDAIYAQYLQSADLNGDGKPDLVVTPHEGIKVLLNTTGTVTPPSTGSGSDQVIGAGGKRSYQFFAPDGTIVNVSLSGPGTATLHFSSSMPISIPEGRGTVPETGLQLASIAATGTTGSTTLSITANYGSRTVTFDSLATDGSFGKIQAPKANINGTITLPGGAKNISLLSVDGGTMTIGGGRAPNIALSQIGSETVNSAVPIDSFRVALDAAMTLTAPSIGMLSVGGNLQDSTISLIALNSAGAVDLRDLLVNRGITNTAIHSAANISRVAAEFMSDSMITAATASLSPAQPLPMAPGDFASAASIGSVSLGISSRQPSFSNSNIAALELRRLDLGTILPNNGGIPFGIAAHHIGAITGTDLASGHSFRMTNVTTSAAAAAALQAKGISPQDFVIRLI